ncbi:hypothetical protein ACHRV6_02390 [Flavobacterium sp. FlaQc-51]|uniref:hypothetical protein n=1 Tax=Flavobacterium sp. FlaQc-51 TaxID=3374184 RepID=UPI0037575680
MRKSLYIFTVFLIFSCKKERPSDYQINEIPVTTNTETISDTANDKLITKYYFIGIGFTEPVSWSTTYVNGEEVKKIVRENHFYTTDIISHDGKVSEDLKYKWLDEAERNMRNSHNSSVSEMLNEPPKTIFRELYGYDSYKEASVALQKIARGDYSENENLNTGEIKYEF